MKKEDLYKRIKIAGMISFIPMMLAIGPLSGYLLGDYLTKKFSLPSYVSFVCIGIGFFIGINEAVKIIRRVSKLDNKS